MDQLLSSDDESAEEEEAEVIRLQKEAAKSMSREDFGVIDSSEDEAGKELTFKVSIIDSLIEVDRFLKFESLKHFVSITVIYI